MNMTQYLGHALRYLIKLLILVAIIYGLMFLLKGTRVSAEAAIIELVTTRTGLLLLIGLVALAAVYPTFGFVRRTVAADIVKDREKILNAFHSEGYILSSEDDGAMTFRTASPLRRFWMVWDDKVKVTSAGEEAITIEGIRKTAVQAQFRMETYMRNENRDV